MLRLLIFSQIMFYQFLSASQIHFHGTEATLNKIMSLIENKEKGVYFRFGDGDLNVAYGDTFYDCVPHAFNPNLQQEMLEAYHSSGPGVLKTLPVYHKMYNSLEPGMFPGNHESSDKDCEVFTKKSKAIWGEEMKHVYSHVALHFSSTHNRELCFRFLNFIKNSNCVLFVGNKNIPVHVRQMLFDSECIFIPTPPESSYAEIDRIEYECLECLLHHPEYKVVVIATGCAGRVLQKRLWEKVDNIFLFDFGSLMDALCGWNTRYWIDLTHFNAPQFIEDFIKYSSRKAI